MRPTTRYLSLFAFLLLCAATAAAQVSYTETLRKADRAFDSGEWASAAALYNFALHERPHVPATYGRAIVSADLMGDSTRVMQLMDQAMSYGVPIDSLLVSVQHSAYEVGQADIYEHFVLRAAGERAYLSRPLDAYLLRYYAFRRNGPEMVRYANKMLAVSPDNVQFLSILADGHMIDGQPALAVDTWQRILAIDPDNVDTLINLGNYYRLAGDTPQALQYLTRANALRPTPYLVSQIRVMSGE